VNEEFKMQKKYLIILIVLLGIISIYMAIMLSDQSFDYSNQNLNNFSKEEISFKYPDTWELENSTVENSIANNYISKLTNPKENESITINRQYNPPGHDPKNFINEELKENESKLDLESNNKYTINNTDVYENTYKLKNDSSIQIRELWVYKNNAIYSIILSGKKSNIIDIIRNNLNIKTAQLTKNPIFATLAIPKLDVKNIKYIKNIRYDSVNEDGVWHYDTSYYPGEKGTVGLLGHDVTHSAPFKNLYTLSKGDKIYINDFLTEKKYIYEVVSNDDIRYDYETNKIQFEKNDKGLIMGTCWPPGSMSAERYCHSKLISVEPI
jgi:sortase A